MSKLVLRVGESGGLSLYGLGRFPISMYVDQWEAVLAAKDEIEAFIAANRDRLKTRSQRIVNGEEDTRPKG